MPDGSRLRWGFIGAGKMASALIRGMISAGVASTESITACDPIESVRNFVAEETGITVFATNEEVAAQSDVLVLAIKPQSVAEVLSVLGKVVGEQHLIISIVAGVSIKTLTEGLGSNPRLVRVMPNTPALVGEGASAYCLAPETRESDGEVVRLFLESVGRVVRVPESQLDAVTGLSGSGPAFVYTIIEALSDGGVRVGLPRDVATTLAAQTVLGAARMVLETGLHTGALKDQVTSPGGTTIAGIHALERGAIRATLIDAVQAATQRSSELSAPPSSHAKG